MNILCSICEEIFSNEENEIIFTTKCCGYVYHQRCILEWLERSKTCPYCRATTDKNSILKLNISACGEASVNEEVNRRNGNREFVLRFINMEKENCQMMEKYQAAIKEIEGLRTLVKKFKKEIKIKNVSERQLLKRIEALTNQSRTCRTPNSRSENLCPDDTGVIVLHTSDSELDHSIAIAERNDEIEAVGNDPVNALAQRSTSGRRSKNKQVARSEGRLTPSEMPNKRNRDIIDDGVEVIDLDSSNSESNRSTDMEAESIGVRRNPANFSQPPSVNSMTRNRIVGMMAAVMDSQNLLRNLIEESKRAQQESCNLLSRRVTNTD